MAKKTISNTFTVNTIIDGESAPYYFQEWFAWSNDASTSSVTTPPTISGSWATSIPEQGSYAYLWRKSIRYVWNESTRQYIGDAAQYFRMSGTNGTSISVKGHVATTANLPTTHNDGDAYVVDADGHLYMWSDEANQWLDIGQFKGESGKTYYTHIAWATNVIYSGSTVTSVEGFVTTKSPNDTTHIWMGVLVDENSGQDSTKATTYTWSNTKGVQGNDAVTYDIVFSEAWARVDNSNTVSAALKGYAYKVEGNTRTVLYGAKIRLGYILNDSDTYVEMTTSYGYFDDGYWFNGDDITGYGKNSANIFAAIIINNAVVCVKYVTIAKQGQTGNRGKVGRFFYYAGAFNVGDSTTQFLVNDAQSPYFSYNNQYWVYNPETNPSGGYATMAQMGNPSASSSKWKIMTNDFKYIITEAIFGAYAHFGSFIINDDWMISQHGTINGQASTNYTQFDPDHPNDNTGTNFIPNFAVDGLTGKTYQNDAHVNGEVVSSSGNIGGFAINSKWLGNLGGTNSQQGWTYITKDGSGHFFNKGETNPWALRAYGKIELEGNGLPVVISNISDSYIMINGRLQIVADALRNTEVGDVYIDTLGLLHVRGNGGGPYFVTDEFGRVTNPSTAYTQDGFRQINVVRGNCTLPSGCPVGTVYYVKGTGSTTVTVTNGSNDWIEGWDDNDNKGNSVGIQSNSVQFVKTATHIWTMFVGI